MLKIIRNLQVRQFLKIVAFSAILGTALIGTVNTFINMRSLAIQEAADKAEIILNHNRAIHRYFADQLRPALHQLLGPNPPDNNFNPILQSNTYAVREINQYLMNGGLKNYSFKEAAVNARNPANEANADELAFLEQYKADPQLKSQSEITVIGGSPYFRVMMPGQIIEAPCLACHGRPEDAPAAMTARYGSQLGFGHKLGELASVISIQVPLGIALQSATQVAAHTSAILTITLVCVYILLHLVLHRWLLDPLNALQIQAKETALNEHRLGEQLPLPPGRELQELTTSFNHLSASLRTHQDELEDRIEKRTLELANSQHLIQEILELNPSAICVLNIDEDHFVYANRQITQFFSTPAATFVTLGEASVIEHIHPEDLAAYQQARAELKTLPEGEAAETRFRVYGPDNKWHWIAFRCLVVQPSSADQPQLVMFVADDVTYAHEAAEKLRYTSTHDALTGLYNWAFFEETVREIRQNGVFPVTFFMMDVDNLKTTNDSQGHSAGDHLLREIGRILLDIFGEQMVVARVGGDEFAAILPGIDQAAAEMIAQKIHRKLVETAQGPNAPLDVVSIGLCTAQDAAGLDDARREADRRMYAAKLQRKSSSANPYRFPNN